MSGLLEGSEMIGDDDVREVSEFVNRKIQTKGGVVYLYLAHQSPIASGEWRVAGDGWASQQRYKSCFIQGPTSMHVQHPNPADGGRGIAPLRKQVSPCRIWVVMLGDERQRVEVGFGEGCGCDYGHGYSRLVDRYEVMPQVCVYCRVGPPSAFRSDQNSVSRFSASRTSTGTTMPPATTRPVKHLANRTAVRQPPRAFHLFAQRQASEKRPSG
jgi:hypothetical protein